MDGLLNYFELFKEFVSVNELMDMFNENVKLSDNYVIDEEEFEINIYENSVGGIESSEIVIDYIIEMFQIEYGEIDYIEKEKLKELILQEYSFLRKF